MYNVYNYIILIKLLYINLQKKTNIHNKQNKYNII